MSRYLIEDTYNGFRLTLLDSVSGAPRKQYDELGGHGPIEQLFVEANDLWLDLRSGQTRQEA